MNFSYDDLNALRQNNKTWRLLNAEHAPLILSFMQQAFVHKGRSMAPESELCQILENIIFNAAQGSITFSGTPASYLNDWSQESKRYLRKTYQSGSDEPFYDITPVSQKALEFVNSLHKYEFVGTASRFRSVIDILRQITLGTIARPEEIIASLKEEIKELTDKLQRAEKGQIPRLSELEVLDRFQQFEQLARGLLSDFRTVEYNLRDLDKGIRQKIAKWTGSKGELLSEVLDNSDGIENSKQGQSVTAFSSLLLNPSLQDEVRGMIDKLYELTAVRRLSYDENVRKIYRGWVNGNEHIQNTMGALSKQLKHFIDDKVYLENRRILELIRDIEKQVIDRGLLEDRQFLDAFQSFEMEMPYAEITLPFERPLYTVKEKTALNSFKVSVGSNDTNADVLFDIDAVDRSELIHNIRSQLSKHEVISFKELCDAHPIKQGLAEILSYFQVIEDNFAETFDESILDVIEWQAMDDPKLRRKTRVKRLYIRERL